MKYEEIHNVQNHTLLIAERRYAIQYMVLEKNTGV